MIDTSTITVRDEREEEEPYLDIPVQLKSMQTSAMLIFSVMNELHEYGREEPLFFQQIAKTAHQPIVDRQIDIPLSVMQWICSFDLELAKPEEILGIVCEFTRTGENGYELVWPVLTVYTPPPAPERDGDGLPNV